MTNAAVADPPSKATDTSADKANPSPSDEAAKGTDADGVTVQGEIQDATGAQDEGTASDAEGEEDPDAPKYSQASLEAEAERLAAEKLAAAENERKASERRQQQEQQKERLKTLHPSVQRAIAAELKTWTRLDAEGIKERPVTDAEIEPIQAQVQILYDNALDAAALDLQADINDWLGEADAGKLWAAINPKGDGATMADTLDAIVEMRALGAKAVKDADPEDLIKANPKLKAHFAKHGDDRYNAGRTQGRKDPAGARNGNEQTVVTGSTWTRAQYLKATPEERRDFERDHPAQYAAILRRQA